MIKRVHIFSVLIVCVAFANLEIGKADAAQCPQGKPVSGKYFITGTDVNFRTAPSAAAEPVVNEKATRILGTKTLRKLSREYALTGICETDGWLYAHITEADGRPVNWEKGWVSKKFVSTLQSADRASGLIWDVDNASFLNAKDKAIMKKGALKVLKEDENCASIMIGDKSTSRPGQYYVTCNSKSGGSVYNVWFRPN
ncbi:MAG: hypothetical protein JJ959_18365 [Nisaea sp.]|uniref:hypothetical protein n=1 Tax=Nisaea sp. TaxID=2024842 RepID=UPI001B14F96F|nr:hypothetical protein [Nisaea sp.]MBO6562517.1 hypothetical protein [Nisaea sp.]